MAEGRVEDIYTRLKAMAVGFGLRPGERLNEGVLARQMGVSRTPLREALNRLVAEKLVVMRPGAGFFCRELDPQTVFDLFELRGVIEVAAARLACVRASDSDLAALRDDLHAGGIEVAGLTVAEACARDEAFHVGIARASGNAVLLGELQRINEKIRYIRWVRMTLGRLRVSKQEHKRIMAALIVRDADAAGATPGAHIARRMDQITEAVRAGISSIYMESAGAVAGRVLAGEQPLGEKPLGEQA